MKIIALILSIYILALNFTPCEDNNAINDDVKVELSQNTDFDYNHIALDLCSPFCQCHCCHIHATYFNTAENCIVSNDISTEIFSHFDSLGEDIHNSILQPPRV